MRYLLLIMIVLLAACGTDDPKPPEANSHEVIPVSAYGKVVEASTTVSKQDLTIRHNVKDKNIYVEVVIPNFNFSSKGKQKKVDGEGYIHLYLNGKKVDEIHQAAFIVKGLPSGKHDVKIELVQNDATSYGVEEEFSVTIP
ncbi:hypothetical protein [Bacillus pinisoli]|uniref:hypothetical protein n=1 Tax=Bacillus pinisoli TaxID=2901866 RepID=UPI001FF54B0E|nr:hypothetical protein [Bacillus pinisoli]